MPAVFYARNADVVLLQREMLSSFVTLEPFARKPRVLDVDDAIFLKRDGRAARRLAQLSDRVICGNDYLADWFSVWNRDVAIIPTAVDTQRLVPSLQSGTPKEGARVIGWVGTSGNLRYLSAIVPALEAVVEHLGDVMIRVVSDIAPDLGAVANRFVEFIPWSPEVEVSSIQGMDVGIMPLEDSSWERGKCSYKMLQYMACGIACVVSPVGMNAQVLAMGDVGISAKSASQWADALVYLLESESARRAMGTVGRSVVEASFSLDVLAPRLAAALRGVAVSP
jgi:glycosyltransferase involved in cell wall biosynthesis